MKQNLIHIEISKNESNRVVDLLLFKNHYALIKKLKIFLGDHNKNFIIKGCSITYINDKTLINHKRKYGEYDKCTIRTSSESHFFGKTFS